MTFHALNDRTTLHYIVRATQSMIRKRVDRSGVEKWHVPRMEYNHEDRSTCHAVMIVLHAMAGDKCDSLVVFVG